MVDLTPFKAGIEAAFSSAPSICSDPKAEALNVLISEGAQVKGAINIGKLERVKGERCKGGDKDFWYIYKEIDDSQNDGHIIGFLDYGYWKDGTSCKWTSRTEHQMSPMERTSYHKALDAMRAQKEAETIKRQSEAAKIAYEIWSDGKDCEDHVYLSNKGVKTTEGLKIAGDLKKYNMPYHTGKLIVPVAVDNQITSLQFIDDDGGKFFLTGGKIKAGWFVIEGETDIVYIAEGYSTARSIFEATGKTVYVAFNAGNLYECASYVKNKHPQSRLIIAGDDDTSAVSNVGRTKAEQAAQGLNIECVFPAGFTDFNDMHDGQGIEALKNYLNPDNIEAYQSVKLRSESDISRPFGVLGDIADYYHATSGNRQDGFAIQTALAVTSIILGRNFKTSLNNYTAIYLLNVGKSGTGKEHAKTVTEDILQQTGYAHLVAGDGYTSAGAVFSTLLDRPKHISVIDEFGRYLEAGKDLKGGNHHQREANTKLMEAVTRTHSLIRPPSYSSMTLKKDAAEAIKNRLVHNPSITLLTMTTPDTLFKTLNMGAIKDGFFNRFIVSISDAERAVRKHKPPIAVPDSIINWANKIRQRNDALNVASEPANAITLEFSEEALAMQEKFQKYTNVELPNKMEKFGMAEISGRTNEMAMKISLICALARDPEAEIITENDMQWAIDYVRTCLNKTIDQLKISLSHSDFEGQKKEVLADLRERGKNGLTWSQMQKTPPYSQHRPKDLKEIMNSLKDADLAADEPYQPPKGRPSVKWIALK